MGRSCRGQIRIGPGLRNEDDLSKGERGRPATGRLNSAQKGGQSRNQRGRPKPQLLASPIIDTNRLTQRESSNGSLNRRVQKRREGRKRRQGGESRNQICLANSRNIRATPKKMPSSGSLHHLHSRPATQAMRGGHQGRGGLGRRTPNPAQGATPPPAAISDWTNRSQASRRKSRRSRDNREQTAAKAATATSNEARAGPTAARRGASSDTPEAKARRRASPKHLAARKGRTPTPSGQ